MDTEDRIARYRNVDTAVGLSDERFALALPKDAKTHPIR